MEAQQAALLPALVAQAQADASVIVTLGPVAQKTLMAECRQAFAPYRWRRFIMRLLGRRRSYLRYLPYPYPPVSTVQPWIQ